MQKINLGQASRLTSPNPLTLVCTAKPSGGSNIMAASWWMYLSFKPGMIGFSLAKTSYSGELIRQTKKAVLAMPGIEIAEAAMRCGSASGRDIDKADVFGVAMQSLPGCQIEIPAETYLAVLCTLRETLEVGDHILYVCDVEQTYGDAGKTPIFSWNGYAELGAARMGKRA